MNGLLGRLPGPKVKYHEDHAVVAPGLLQNPAVRNWLGGIEPAWTLLDQTSFAALRQPRLPVAVILRQGQLRQNCTITDI
jgi:hypothetical protein